MRPPTLPLCAQIVGQQACTEFWEGREVVESESESEGEDDADAEALKALKELGGNHDARAMGNKRPLDWVGKTRPWQQG